LAGKPEEKISLRRPRHMCKNNKMVIKEIGWGGTEWGDLVWKEDLWRALVITVMKHHVS
jgi:hypothetical protein